jgi:hypothetical protein
MKTRLVRFNINLLLFLGLAWGGWGCGHTKTKEKEAAKKGFNDLNLHLEVNADGSDRNGTVMVGRQTPFPVNVEKVACIDTTQLGKVSLVDDEVGGFKMMLQFNREGTGLLQQCTVAFKGRHLAVFAELDDFRWIAAPLITKTISDGVFTFTPDATREEADKLALGLNKTIKKIRSKNTFNDPEVK